MTRPLTSWKVHVAGATARECVQTPKNLAANVTDTPKPLSVRASDEQIQPEPARFAATNTANCKQVFYTIPDLALRWHCSRATVYNVLRGEIVIDFAPRSGKKGHKLVPSEVVEQIENRRTRRLT